MQQIFSCPVCGAQNYVGQVHCQVCGQRFQYNCPYCGAVVDSTLVNCPGCRQSLFWPTPQRVKPFPKQPAIYQSPAPTEAAGQEPKKKSKSDPWLTGCLGLIIIAIILLAAYFVYDNYIKEKSTPTLPPVSAAPSLFENS
jgi:Double zinc ribbon